MLENELHEAVSRNAEHIDEINRLNSENVEFQDALNQMDFKNTQIDTQAKFDSLKDVYESQMNQLRKEYVELQNSHQIITSESEDLQRGNLEKLKEVHALESKYRELERVHTQDLNELRKEIIAMKNSGLV